MDMTESDHFAPKIDDDSLGHIFEELDSLGKHHLLSAMQVSRRWKVIAEPIIYRHIQISHSREFIMITMIVSNMKYSEDRERTIGSWIRSFEWKEWMSDPLTKDVLNDLIYMLSHTTGLQRLRLPRLRESSVFTIPLNVSAGSLRSLHISVGPDMIHEITSVKLCQYLAELSVYCCDVDWSRVDEWTLPHLRHLVWDSTFWTSKQSGHDIAFLQRCTLASLSYLDLEVPSRNQTHEAGAQIGAYLQSLPSLKLFKSNSLPFYCPQALRSVRAPCLKMPPLPDFLPFLPPCVKILAITWTPDNTKDWEFFDYLAEEPTNIEQVHVSFEARWSTRYYGPTEFSWLSFPNSYESKSLHSFGQREIEHHYGNLVFRLLGYAHRLCQRGITLCDSHGRTAFVAPAIAHPGINLNSLCI